MICIRLKYFNIILGTILLASCNNEITVPSSSSSSINLSTLPVDSTKKVDLHFGVGIETGEIGFYWTAFDDAIFYELEESINEYFIGSSTVYKGPSTRYNLGYPSRWFTHYYHVRAYFANAVSVWSNSVQIP